MDPWPVKGNAEQSIGELEAIVQSMPRTRIVERTERYLRAEFRSRGFRFVDDVEFYIPTESEPGAGFVQFRSASRLGYSDLGVNRQRMEQILALWQQ
jgi:uncharacterized protein (DUF1499 family)